LIEAASGLDLGHLSAPLLSGWYDEWVVEERERLRRHQLDMLMGRACVHLERGHASAAVIDATWAVTVDPLNESAHQLLLRCHLAEGNVSEAMRHFAELRHLLDAELGVRPFSDTIRIIEPCLR
jgi:DNA-binding SARP family transcriptional activator